MAKTDYKAISNKTWEFSESMHITRCLTNSPGCCDVVIAHIIISFSSQCLCGDKQSLLFHRFLTAWQLLDEKVWVCYLSLRFLQSPADFPAEEADFTWNHHHHEATAVLAANRFQVQHADISRGRNNGSEKQLNWKRQRWHWKLSFPIKMQILLSTCTFSSRQNSSFSVSRP